MKKINYYIGSNNKTHELEKDKALTILSEAYEGMTTSELVGYWKGASERTLLVSIVCDAVDYTQVKTICKRLNNELDQDAVMVEILDSNTLFISDR
jgi:hypothetical protein